MPFLLNEDKALKTMLGGLVVSDFKNANRPVGVWFGQPDVEIRNQSFPYVTIELIDIVEDPARNNRGYGKIPYTPEGKNSTKEYYSELPVPVDIEYQVVSYTRQPIHDRQITAEILQSKLPFRYGTLEIPEDGTLRRVELVGYRKRDIMESGKKLYSSVFLIRVSSELFYSAIVEAAKQVSTIGITTNSFINKNVTKPS